MSDEGIYYEDDLPEDVVAEVAAGRAQIGGEIEYAPSVTRYEMAALEDWIINATGVGSYYAAQQSGVDGWAQYGVQSTVNPDVNQRQALFERNEYRTPRDIFSEFRLANKLVMSDDIVSGICELTENLAIQRHKWETVDLDEEDIWRQISIDLELDQRLKEMWREAFTYSQFYVAMFWGKKTYKVQGKNPKTNVSRRKSYTLNVPISMSLLDPTRVIPVGNLMFNQERLAWIALKGEIETFNKQTDKILNSMFEGKYTCSQEEKGRFESMGIDTEMLMLLKKDAVWRFTLPRPAYKRWADVRLKSIFPLADLKSNLRMMDRAHLVGGTNFILVVKKGSDKIPARQQELDNLQRNVRTLARVPVLVGDHRLSVEIVTPQQDNTLLDKKWDTLDSRIGSRLLMSLAIGGDQGRRDDSLTIGRAVARGIEGRRHLLSRALEKNIVDPVMAKNPELKERPQHVFTPKHVALDWDANFVNLLIQLRDRGDLSRETVLEEADFNQDVEFRNREYEDEVYDKIFLKPTLVPFTGQGNGSNTGTTPKTAAGNSRGGADNKTGSKPPGRPAGSRGTGSSTTSKSK